MSSPCLTGGGRAYGFDLEIVKSPSTSTRTSQTSSPSSTISESSNSQLSISTRKSRTPRKRPNQTYNEAAALLSTANPKVFPTKHLTNPRKSTKSYDSLFYGSTSELLLPFRVIDSSAFLLHNQILEKPISQIQPKFANLLNSPCRSPGEVDFQANSMELDDSSFQEDDLDAESILDEEIEEGIDSIMGDIDVSNSNKNVGNEFSSSRSCFRGEMNPWNWNPMGFGMKMGGGGGGGGVRAMRHVDDGNWWCFPTVNVLEISPRLLSNINNVEKKKKKVEAEKAELPRKLNPVEKANSNSNSNSNYGGLLLKLNYEEIVDAWSDRASPFPDDVPGSDSPTDVSARLAQIDLFSDGGLREASVLRYKEKRRTRLFSKKIRYQVRKVNADRRPRMKGRFVRRPNSSSNGQR